MNSDFKLNSSPERHTFQKEGYVKRCEEEGTLPNPEYLEMYKTWRQQDEEKLLNPEWQKDNMEYDLRSTKWICDKAKESESYAQNLYAAMCNMQFMKLDTMPILKNQRWSASWRSAGGIVADMREEGDYINWYCSGIRGENPTLEELEAFTPDQLAHQELVNKFVGEGVVTDEIKADLKKLGWIPLEWEEE